MGQRSLLILGQVFRFFFSTATGNMAAWQLGNLATWQLGNLAASMLSPLKPPATNFGAGKQSLSNAKTERKIAGKRSLAFGCVP